MPKPITKGFNITPFCCKALDTAQGSPLQASIPSVIKIMMFLQFSQGGKSVSDASKDLAIKVVPVGRVAFITCFILSILSFSKGTSRCVSSQS